MAAKIGMFLFQFVESTIMCTIILLSLTIKVQWIILIWFDLQTIKYILTVLKSISIKSNQIKYLFIAPKKSMQ